MTDCLEQWSTFWSKSADTTSSTETERTSFTVSTIETLDRGEMLSEMLTTMDVFDPGWPKSLISYTTTQTLLDNGHLFATTTFTTTTVATLNPSAVLENLSGTQSFYTITKVYETSSYLSENLTTQIATPACVLPSIVPQCQVQWDSWISFQLATIERSQSSYLLKSTEEAVATAISNNASLEPVEGPPTPLCTVAQVDAAQCNGLRSLYLSTWSDSLTSYGAYTPLMTDIGFQPTEVTGLNGSIVTSKYWPSTSYLAPDCSLGCGSCAITGNTVQLFYWPVFKTQEAMNHTKRDYQPITAYTLNTTFVSPTAYVYYSQIYALNSCGTAVGQTYHSRFIPVTNTSELSSVWASVDTSALVYDGGAASSDVPSLTAPFNFTDLNTPVPDVIYGRQPWCVSWATSKMRFLDPEGITEFAVQGTVPLVCPRTRSYDPVLVVPLHSLQAIDPLWSTCSFDLRDAFDPPYDLQQAAAAATPTSSDVMPTVAATPASIPHTSQPVQTSKGDPALPTPPAKVAPSNFPKNSGVNGKDPKSPVPAPHTSKGPGESRSPTEPATNPDHPASLDTGVSSLHSHLGESQAGGVTDSMITSSIAAILAPHSGHWNVDSSILAGFKSDVDNAEGAGGTAGSRNSLIQNSWSFDPQSPQSDPVRVQSAMPNTKPNLASPGQAVDSSPAESLISSSEDPTPNLATGYFHASSTLLGATVLPYSQVSALDNPKMGNKGDPNHLESGNSESADTDSSPNSPMLLGKQFSGAVITASATTFTAYQVGASGKIAVPNGLKWGALSVGGPAAIIGKHTISAASGGIVDNGITTVAVSNHLDAEPPTQLIAPFIISSTVYTAFKNSAGHHKEVIIPVDGGSIELLPGGAATKLNGQLLSAGAKGIVVGTNTVLYSEVPPDSQFLAALTISGTANIASLTAGEPFVPMDSKSMTLLPGNPPVLLNGRILSAAPNGVVVGGSTYVWSTETSLDIVATISGTTTRITELGASFTISGTPYIAVKTSIPGRGEVVVISAKSAGMTLWPGGPAATVNSETVSTTAEVLVTGGVIETMATVTNSREESPVATSRSTGPGYGASGGKFSESSGSGVPNSGSGRLGVPWNISCVCKVWGWVLKRVLR
ncbi:MAG: hypothetical protein M1822_008548 [Bathelium mastoideum]|nr:MAG: hypothetical protein M1822_008548 [Bathelium mastoideum]